MYFSDSFNGFVRMRPAREGLLSVTLIPSVPRNGKAIGIENKYITCENLIRARAMSFLIIGLKNSGDLI